MLKAVYFSADFVSSGFANGIQQIGQYGDEFTDDRYYFGHLYELADLTPHFADLLFNIRYAFRGSDLLLSGECFGFLECFKIKICSFFFECTEFNVFHEGYFVPTLDPVFGIPGCWL